MSFFAILFALLVEQARPLSSGNPIHAGMRAWVRLIERSLDTGRAHHGWLAWAQNKGREHVPGPAPVAGRAVEAHHVQGDAGLGQNAPGLGFRGLLAD